MVPTLVPVQLLPVQLPDGTFGQGTAKPFRFSGAGTLDPFGQGRKDVIRVEPGTAVTVAGQLSGATGRFVYHCHIPEHEDEDMMHPFLVMPAQVAALTG